MFCKDCYIDPNMPKRKSTTKRKGKTKKARTVAPAAAGGGAMLEDDEYYVEKILARAKVAPGGEMRYLVRWKDYKIENGGCT